jgi:hypothetical protein
VALFVVVSARSFCGRTLFVIFVVLRSVVVERGERAFVASTPFAWVREAGNDAVDRLEYADHPRTSRSSW